MIFRTKDKCNDELHTQTLFLPEKMPHQKILKNPPNFWEIRGTPIYRLLYINESRFVTGAKQKISIPPSSHRLPNVALQCSEWDTHLFCEKATTKSLEIHIFRLGFIRSWAWFWKKSLSPKNVDFQRVVGNLLFGYSIQTIFGQLMIDTNCREIEKITPVL